MNKERLELIRKMQKEYGVEKGTNFSSSMQNTEYGKDCLIGKNCVIGGKGFGYERDENGVPQQFPHIGKVVIGDNVEIGDNTVINRGTIGDTVIGDNVKIDGQVFIAHNARIGARTLVVAGAVVCGSAVIGEDCFLGANCVIKNKVTVGNGAIVGMGAVVTKDIPAGETWAGNPAEPLKNK